MRLRTGVIGFDNIIEGGLLENRVYLLSGPPGSGKTTFSVQFLSEGARNGEVGLYVSLVEDPKNIINDMGSYMFNLKQYVTSRKIFFVDLGPLSLKEHQEISNTSISNDDEKPLFANEVIEKLDGIVKKADVKRLVIDSMMTIRFAATNPSVEEKEMTRFIRSLKELGCTTILLSEMTDPNAYTVEQFLAHGVIFMHNFLAKDQMLRAIQVIKMRGTRHDCNMRKITFSDSGITVGADVVNLGS